MLRQTISTLLRQPATTSTAVRSFASPPAPGSLVKLEVDDKSGIATLTLNRPPVNSLSLELLTDISTSLDQVQDNRSRGLILTSSGKSVFSAGLDIMEMYKPDETRMKQFWSALQDVWLKLYGSAYPTAVAINGHSPAGGCLLATCCDHRVMLPNYTIGLNETRLGMIAPRFFEYSFRNVLPSRVAERALTLGTLFTTEEALKIGLIDEVATDREDALARCAAFLAQFKAVSPLAAAMTKQSLRREGLEALRQSREQDLELFVFTVNQPKMQKGLEAYLASLKKK